MKISIIASMIVFASNFAFAGATHRWCLTEAQPNVKICQDQRGHYIQTHGNPLVAFKFAGYGEDRSTVKYVSTVGEFKLVTTEWGMSKTLVDSQDNSYLLQCGSSQFGLCPKSHK